MGRLGRRRRLAGAPGRGTLAKDKPPILDVQQATIKPVIEAAVAKDTLVHTDEYGIYAPLPA
jgi:hypothetical protein